MKQTVVIALILSVAMTPALAEPRGKDRKDHRRHEQAVKCDDFQAFGVGVQDDPQGIFRGKLTYTIVTPDAVGVPQPTGENIQVEFTSWALGLLNASEGRTTNRFTSAEDDVDVVQLDEFTLVPRADGSLGLLDVGDIASGAGRWNCGRSVAGINPVTGEPLSSIRFFDPITGTQGEAVIVLQGRFCDCDD